MTQSKTADLIADVNKNIASLVDVVKDVAERVKTLENKTAPEQVQLLENTLVTPQADEPNKYQSLVNVMLNSEFKSRVESSVNPANFKFTVYVPRKYSTASQGHWDMYHEDACIGEVEVVKGEVGVKEHIERVFRLFPPDIQALIVADRRFV